MLNYLERNLKFLEELKQINPIINENAHIIGKSSNTKFIHFKTFKSKILNQEIDVGLKLSNESSFEDKFYTALTNIAFLYEKNPEIIDKLPLFYGLLVNKDNNSKAIITQDFSMDNKFIVEEYLYSIYRTEDIPFRLDNFFSSCKNDLERMIFLVMGGTKIGDLDHVSPKKEYVEEWENLRNKILFEKHKIYL